MGCRTGTEGDCKLGLKVGLEPWCEGFHARLRNPHFVREAPGASAGFGHKEQENTLPYRKVLLILMCRWNNAESWELGGVQEQKAVKEVIVCLWGEGKVNGEMYMGVKLCPIRMCWPGLVRR